VAHEGADQEGERQGLPRGPRSAHGHLSDDDVPEVDPHDDTVEPDPLEDPEDVEAELDRYRWSKWKSAD